MTDKKKTVLTVGRTLWYVPDRNGRRDDPEGFEVTVEKIGRVWATLARHRGRINIHSLVADGEGYSSPGRCFLSREHHDAFKRAETAWLELSKRLWHGNRPIWVTEADIRRAAEILLIEPPEAPND